jgi:energy-coupling factor transporter ATP-binding protein EcfA2
MSIVNVKDLTFTYLANEEPTLKRVSLNIEEGETLGLIGPVGAGKTTLCMAIAGFVPSVTGGDLSGEIEVNVGDSQKSSQPRRNSNNSSEEDSSEDRNNSKDRETRNNQQIGQVGMVFEEYAAQLTHLQVLNELIPALRGRGVSKDEAPEQARELLNKVGLQGQDIENRRVWQLSGGEQLRLAFGKVLALDPPIIILDNILDKLDPKEQDLVIQIVKDLGHDKTIVIVEQNITLLNQLVDRFLVLVDGEVIAEGDADEILRDREILSRANILPPVPLRVARDLGLSQTPLTPEEFEQAIGSVKKQNNYQENNHSSSGGIMGVLSFIGQSAIQQLTAMSFGQPAVNVENVTYYYGNDDDDENKIKALDDINITIREGEVHGVIGRSGAGKTTLIQLLAGLIQPTEGDICICNVYTDERDVPELAMIVGTVLENPDSYLSEKTVRQEIGFPLKQRQRKYTRYDDYYIEQRVLQVSELVGVEEKLFDRDPFLLPRGQRKLVTIAEALVVDPKVLLLDEPGVGLGETSRHKISQMLTHLCNEGKAVLVTGNDTDFIANLVDTVTILEQGQVVLQGSVQEVFAPENWDRLSELHLQPPISAQLAKRVGVDALKYDELVSKLSSK